MAIQDSDSLVMTALSILADPRPDLNQPLLDNGVHLRWLPGAKRGFPLKGGYYVFRRRVGGAAATPTCLRAFLASTPFLDIVTARQLVTPLGTISRPTGDPLPVVPFEPDPQKDKAFLLGSTELQLTLPPGTTAEGLQMSFRMRLPAGAQPGTVIVNGFLQGQLVFAKRAIGANQDDLTIAVDTGKFDRLDFPQAPALVYEICASLSSGTASSCLMPLLKNSDPASVASQRSLITGIGTLLEVNGPHLNPVPAATGTTGILGFSIHALQFSLPAGKTASQFSVTLRFTVRSSPTVAVPPEQQAQITASLAGAVVFTRSVAAPSPNQDVTITANPAVVDSILISSGTDVSVVLLDLCYAPAPAATPTVGGPVPIATAGSVPSFPGHGWELIPNLSSGIKLPLIHPFYPASAGPESIDAATAIAKSRFHYGVWENSFQAASPTPGAGTVTLTSGSAIATGSGANWTSDLIGSFISLPTSGADHTAYAVMAVLAPDRIVLSRSYSGPDLGNASYQLLKDDDFAQLHDQIACLLQSPNNMRAAIAPPPLDEGTVASGKCVLAFGGISTVQGIGTHWSARLAGCYIEIGPTWFQGSTLEERNVYRIVSVNSAVQLTLDRPFTGRASFITPFTKGDYRILARAGGDAQDPERPAFEFKPMDLIELATLMPSYAQALGLFSIDTSVARGDQFDYIVLADHQNLFVQQVINALAWLNGAPDFSGDVDGYAILGVKHLGASVLQPPSQLALFKLPGNGTRISIAHPDRADSDVGISVRDVAGWKDANTPQPTPVMLNLWRLARGAIKTVAVGNDTSGYDNLDKMVPSGSNPSAGLKLPAGWPPDPPHPIHFIDSGLDGTGLDVGWYSYRANNIDIFGRWSAASAPAPWTVVATARNGVLTTTTLGDAVHLDDRIAPPPPAGVLAWILDDRDPDLLRDATFTEWRKNFAGVVQWANWKPGDPVPTITTAGHGVVPIPPAIGLRLRWRWPWAHQNQGPDLREFRIYFESKPLNARPGRVTSVAAGQPKHSVVTLDLGAADSSAPDAYRDASLQAGNRSFKILASQSGATVQLTVQNGGASQNEPPDVNVDGAIVIPPDHLLHKELLDPRNWEQWLAAVPQNLAATRYEVEMVEDSFLKTFDNPDNTFTGARATWNGSAFVLETIPAPNDLAAVRPGIDVLALASDNPPAYFVIAIQSVQVAGRLIAPVQPRSALSSGATYQWRLGPADAGLQGIAGQWDAAGRRFTLDGNPDLTNVTVGADLLYVAAAGVTPADLSFYFVIDAFDAANHTLTLNGTSAQLGALAAAQAPLAWQIGRPVRYYELILPDSAVAAVTPAPDLDVPTLLIPTLAQPVAYGAVGISSVDWRDEVDDQVSPSRNRKGNESFLAGPATVFQVLRDPPPAPDYVWKGSRLYATRADYHAKSFFTVRWNKPVKGPYFAHVLRAMDSSLFLAHWNRTAPIVIPASGEPPAIPGLFTSFDAHRVKEEYAEAAQLYDQLDDVTLAWLAGRPELEDAYMQVTINLLSLDDPANQDHLGPDNDPATFHANPAVCAYTDTLDGRSTNRYFYRVMLLDGAQNRSPLGNPTPPIYLPRVTPPRTPVITKAKGADRQITLRWVCSREQDLKQYRVFRTIHGDQASDVRKLGSAWAALSIDDDPKNRPAEIVFEDQVPGDVTFYYRITATDSFDNVSTPSPIVVARAFDLSIPGPPAWISAAWGEVAPDGSATVIQTGQTANPNARPAVQLLWSTESRCRTRLERRPLGTSFWSPASAWLTAETFENSSQTWSFRMLVLDADPNAPCDYRILTESLNGKAGEISQLRALGALQR